MFETSTTGESVMPRKNPPKEAQRDPGEATPGRPKSTGSRQQTQPNQTSQSGSEEFDQGQTREGGDPADGAKPASAK
jgi:hypothetical protein